MHIQCCWLQLLKQCPGRAVAQTAITAIGTRQSERVLTGAVGWQCCACICAVAAAAAAAAAVQGAGLLADGSELLLEIVNPGIIGGKHNW